MSSTLHERLGGGVGITQLVDDMMAAYLRNPIIRTRFEAIKDLERAKQITVEFFCANSGGPQEYTGLDMVSRHRGMNISEQEFIAVVDDILASMDKNKFGEAEKRDVLAFVYSMKDKIIRR
jgi:hemoglobin